MLSEAFVVGRVPTEALRKPSEDFRPNLSPLRTSSTASGWSQFVTAGALLAAAALRLGRRRNRATREEPAAATASLVPQAFSGATILVNTGLDARKAAQSTSGVTMRFKYLRQRRMKDYGRHSGHNKPDWMHWSGTGWKRRGIWTRDKKVELWLKWSVEMQNKPKTSHRVARREVMRKFKLMKRDRAVQRMFNIQTWRERMRANAKMHGLEYRELREEIKEKKIHLNRKMMSELGIYDRNVLSTIIQVAVPDWRERVVEKENEGIKKTYTTEELDSIALPYLESQYADLYTDPCIRFNRTVTDWGVEYTIDSGNDEKSWADMIAQTPELANFQVPDHWVQDTLKQEEEVPLEMAFAPRDETLDPLYNKYMREVRATQEAREEALAAGKSPKDLGLREEPLKREDWFEGKPQSWL